MLTNRALLIPRGDFSGALKNSAQSVAHIYQLQKRRVKRSRGAAGKLFLRQDARQFFGRRASIQDFFNEAALCAASGLVSHHR
ncbi:MAG TPA: hypothetical protein VMI74_18025 [Burkholderiales bacterium]|nr:hypothetical protein [Burkholderiales bacterium]